MQLSSRLAHDEGQGRSTDFMSTQPPTPVQLFKNAVTVMLAHERNEFQHLLSPVSPFDQTDLKGTLYYLDDACFVGCPQRTTQNPMQRSNANAAILAIALTPNKCRQ